MSGGCSKKGEPEKYKSGRRSFPHLEREWSKRSGRARLCTNFSSSRDAAPRCNFSSRLKTFANGVSFWLFRLLTRSSLTLSLAARVLIIIMHTHSKGCAARQVAPNERGCAPTWRWRIDVVRPVLTTCAPTCHFCRLEEQKMQPKWWIIVEIIRGMPHASNADEHSKQNIEF